MRHKIKITIVLLIVALAGLLGFWTWFSRTGQRVTWTTPSGEERGIVIPKIPGMELVSGERGDCSYTARYLYTFYKDKNLTSYIRDALKNQFTERGWQLAGERLEDEMEIVDFNTEKAGVLEVMTIKLGFQEGAGTSFDLEYRWPPCSAGQ